MRHATTSLMFMVFHLAPSPADLSSVIISIKFICENWWFALYWRGGSDVEPTSVEILQQSEDC